MIKIIYLFIISLLLVSCTNLDNNILDKDVNISNPNFVNLIMSQINISNPNIEIEKLSNGIIVFNRKNNITHTSNITFKNKEEVILYAKTKLNVPNDYKLESFVDSQDTFKLSFNRYVDDIKLNMDRYAISIEKESKFIPYYKKTKTDNTSFVKKFDNLKINKKLILENIEPKSKIKSIRKSIYNEEEKIYYAYDINYYNVNGDLKYIVLNALTYKRI